VLALWANVTLLDNSVLPLAVLEHFDSVFALPLEQLPNIEICERRMSEPIAEHTSTANSSAAASLSFLRWYVRVEDGKSFPIIMLPVSSV